MTENEEIQLEQLFGYKNKNNAIKKGTNCS